MSPSVVCDLDGVVYLGNSAIPGSGDALRRLASAGIVTVFATNNSARAPSEVRAKLHDIAGVDVPEHMIVTSAIVGASLLEDGPVLVVGERGLAEAVARAGFPETDDPAAAASVIVGLDRRLTYERIAAAAEALRRGARLVVTNRDPTYPTERGLLPGAGACVAAVETAAGVTGVTAGKPSTEMRRHLEALVPEGPIWMIGDRIDTDISLAVSPRWRSILVLTGVTESAEGASPMPDRVTADLAAAVRLVLDEEATEAGVSDVSG